MTRDDAEGSSETASDLTGRQRAVLIGTLLGDGCLAKHGRHSRLHVKHKSEHRALAEFKRSTFIDYVTMPLHEFDQRLGNRRYPCVQFATRTHRVFSEWRERFYGTGRKAVPPDVADLLSPLAIAVWFMDDGAADHFGATFPDPQLHRGRSSCSRKSAEGEIRSRGKTEGQSWRHDHLCSGFRNEPASRDRWPACAPGVGLQADATQSSNPVETIRWPPGRQTLGDDMVRAHWQQ